MPSVSIKCPYSLEILLSMLINGLLAQDYTLEKGVGIYDFLMLLLQPLLLMCMSVEEEDCGPALPVPNLKGLFANSQVYIPR